MLEKLMDALSPPKTPGVVGDWKVRRLAVMLAGCLLAGCSEVEKNTYSDVDAARQEGAFKRGWLPEPLPPSARNIREAHNLDTNEGWLLFEFNGQIAGLDSLYTSAGWQRVPAHEVERMSIPEAPLAGWDRMRGAEPRRVYIRKNNLTGHRWWVLLPAHGSQLLSWHHD